MFSETMVRSNALQYTGRRIIVKITYGSLVNIPEATIHVDSPFIAAAMMVNPIFDIIGNIKRVKNSCSIDAATQTGCFTVTRSMEKRKSLLH